MPGEVGGTAFVLALHGLRCPPSAAAKIGFVRRLVCSFSVGVGWLNPERRRWGRCIEIGSIEIVLAGDPDESEKSIAARIGECRAHPLWRCRLADGADRPVRGDPFAGRMRNTVVSLIRPAAWSTAVVCRVAISCWPKVLRRFPARWKAVHSGRLLGRTACTVCADGGHHRLLRVGRARPAPWQARPRACQ